jgi:hypothetical protein
MPWVRFTEDFDFSPVVKGGRVTKAYKAGMVQFVTRECATRALAAGKAKRAQSTRKASDDGRARG